MNNMHKFVSVDPEKVGYDMSGSSNIANIRDTSIESSGSSDAKIYGRMPTQR